MLLNISDRLTQAVEKRRLKEKIEQDLHSADQSLELKSDLLRGLERQLEKEQVDVEMLEKLSLTGLFYTVLGSREQQVEKERQEMLAAQLKYQQAKQEVEALQLDKTYLEMQMNELEGVENEYAALLAEKESLLRQANSPLAGDLLRLSEQIANRNAEKREINEALVAANHVLTSLEAVIESLESAEGWGTWDLLGGGLLATAGKHWRIDDARQAVQEVQVKLSRLTRELADVQRSTDLKIDISGLDVFADYFFDGLIMDWIVQSKIQNSLEQTRRAKERIAQAVKDLGKLKAAVLSHSQRLNEQRTALIEQA